MQDLSQFTKKNQEFIHIATHQLIKDGKSDKEIKEILENVLPTILENQKKGIPARTFLGAPTAWAHEFTVPKESKKTSITVDKNTNPWLMWLDSSLFLTALVLLMNGMLPIFGNDTSQISGIISILTLGFLGGAAIYAIYHFIYSRLGTSERPSMPKIIAIVLTSMAVWVLLSFMTELLPTSINARLHYSIYLILATIFFLTHLYIQKKYNIQNAMSPIR
ncbi:DUF1129 domain-containing protein [Streptococcus fryi]